MTCNIPFVLNLSPIIFLILSRKKHRISPVPFAC
nr:MAG TPA: hypothetical protein [Caudoviricetes sp.]